jgi:hypothetical protein
MYQFKNDTNKIRVETWFPYYNGSCARKVENILRIEECVVDMETKVPAVTSFNQELYPKFPKKLHQCTLRVAAVIWEPFVVSSNSDVDENDELIVDSGLEVLMLKTISEGMQFKIKISNVNKERATKFFSENNRTGLYAKLLSK